MRKLLFIFIVGLMCVRCQENTAENNKETPVNEVKEINDTSSRVESAVPLWNNSYKNYSIDNNKHKSGFYSSWYSNGQLEYEANYKDGILDGKYKRWYQNGKLESEGKYKNDKKEGLWKRWEENGFYNEYNYKEGRLEGSHKRWDDNGQICGESNYKNGQLITRKEFYKHGGLYEVIYKHGQRIIEKEWYSKGQLHYEYNFEDGSERYWDEDGNEIGIEDRERWVLEMENDKYTDPYGYRVDWDKRKKWLNKINSIEDGPDKNLYGSDCTMAPDSASASSSLKPQGKYNYSSANLNDWDPRTAWIEGSDDFGIGEYFEVSPLNDVYIMNGYQRTYTTWKNNSRVKKFKVYADAIHICDLELEDKMGIQSFDMSELTSNEYEELRFEIVEVYKGDQTKDVAISEIFTHGCCFNKSTKIIYNNKEISIADVNKGLEISCFNIKTNEITNTKVLRTIKQTHSSLLKITTSGHTVELTPLHPLYIKGYGLISLVEVRRQNKSLDYQDLVNNIEILVWNDKQQKSEYQKLTSIQKIKGTFETYTIQELEKGMNYIANGFITSVY